MTMKDTLAICVIALGIGLMTWGLIHCIDYKPLGLQLLSAGTVILAGGVILYN